MSQSPAALHITNLVVTRNEFIHHWNLVALNEDGRLASAAAAMGWNSNREVKTEFSGDFFSDPFVVINTALTFTLQHELLHRCVANAISKEQFSLFWNSLSTLQEISNMVFTTSAFGSQELANQQALEVESLAEVVDSLMIKIVSDEEYPYFSNLLDDIVTNCFDVVDASTIDADTDDSDFDGTDEG